MSKYKAAAAKLFGGVKAKTSSAISAARSKGASATAALARSASGDSLGGLFASNVGPGVAAVGFGAADNTEWGKKLVERTGGWIAPSTAAFVLGAAARGLNLDKRYLGKNITNGNTQMLRALIPVKLYQMGARIPGAVGKLADKPAAQMSSGKGVAGIAGTSGPVIDVEPVPGEATVS